MSLNRKITVNPFVIGRAGILRAPRDEDGTKANNQGATVSNSACLEEGANNKTQGCEL